MTSDILFQRFGRLVVARRFGSEKKKNKSSKLWYCLCDCGGSTITRTFMLTSGRTQSCGCRQIEIVKEAVQPRKIITQKLCPNCGITKDVSEFGKRASSTDGYKSHCKKCNYARKAVNMPRLIEQNYYRKEYIRRACPKWVDRNEIVAIYEQAALLTTATGIKHHVDHIYPLKGENFSGLHVPWNLRPVPWIENLRKGNKEP